MDVVNIAIVIAVSKYADGLSDLPACQYDAAAMRSILDASGRFTEILFLTIDTNSAQVKRAIAEFATKYTGQKVSEVVFYFSGHGDYQSNEFYYLLSDYNPKKQRQSSLENSELDNLIRTLSPGLFVKIVDACQSGLSYIKSREEFKEYLNKGNNQFDSLYFLYSSQVDQSSYQDARLSLFTASLLRAVVDYKGQEIRYKDIIDSISDEFESSDSQTPFFVTQAKFTEPFSTVTPELKLRLQSYLQMEEADSATVSLGSSGRPKTIVDLLREEADRFASREEAERALTELAGHTSGINLGSELAELYVPYVSTETQPPPNSAAIGTWLSQSKDDILYFAKPETKTEEYTSREPKSRLFPFPPNNSDEFYRSVQRHRTVILGYVLTADMPYRYIRVQLNPSLANLAPEECLIAPILSRTHLRVFWSFRHYEYVDWNKTQSVGTPLWATQEAPLKEPGALRLLIEDIVSKFTDFVEAPLRTRLSALTDPVGEYTAYDGDDDDHHGTE